MKASRKLFLFLLFIAGCAPAYIPNALNVPLYGDKNQAQINLSAGTAGYDLQGSFSFSKNFALMANYNVLYFNSTTDPNVYNHHTFYEFALGYHSYTEKIFRFETYVGYGLGRIDISSKLITSYFTSNVDLQRIFFQPNFGISSALGDISFSPRIVFLDLKPDLYQYTTVKKFFIEPTVSVKIGFKYFFLTTQLGIALPLNITNSEWFSYQPLIFSVGMTGKIF